jgi:hypothetical protein
MQVTTTTFGPFQQVREVREVQQNQQTIPQAIPVSDSNTISVNQDKLAEHLAESQSKILVTKQKSEEKELKRLIDARIQFEKFESEERVKIQKKDAQIYREQQEIEWRTRNPSAAEEKDRIAREQAYVESIQKNAESQRKIDEQNAYAQNKLMLEELDDRNFKSNTKCAGYTFIGVGVGLLYFSYL